MIAWSEYRTADGAFTGRQLSGSLDWVLSQVAPGCALIEGRHDHLCRRVHSGAVIAWQPPKPAATELFDHRWDAEIERWVQMPTDLALAAEVRAEVSRRFAECDWVTLRAMRTGQPIPTPWQEYMAALAAVTDQPPRAVVWPVRPDQGPAGG